MILPFALHLLLALSSSPVSPEIPDEPDNDDYNVDFLHSEMSSMVLSGTFEMAGEGTGYTNNITADAPFRRARRGILVVGKGDSVRALEPFKGSGDGIAAYTEAVNEYAAILPAGINIYCMPVPTAIAYYCPELATSYTASPRSAMLDLFRRLDQRVIPVDIYPTLGLHAAEPIYSRTDHHWAPLGAYYAAGCFASVAGAPFMPLSEYDSHSLEGYVGTMARFSADKAVTNAPEDFVYYTPRDTSYTVDYIEYKIHKPKGATIGTVTGQSEPRRGPFFYDSYKGAASYLTFMGGDSRLTHVTTSAHSGRRLMILKDSFGNALPPYLFGAFDEIHVVDCRYFTPNIVEYIQQHNISDILFVNNMTHVVSRRTSEAYRRYLTQ